MFKKEQFQNFLIFDKNHGLTPLENFNFFTITKSTFLLSKMAFFTNWNIDKHFLSLVFLKEK